MGLKKLVQITLAAIIAIGAILSSLTHATLGDSGSDVSRWRPYRFKQVVLPAQIQGQLNQVTGFINSLEPNPGILILRPDGQVLLMETQENPSAIGDIQERLETRADSPRNGYIDDREDNEDNKEKLQKRTDPPGGGRSRAVDGPGGGRRKHTDGKGGGSRAELQNEQSYPTQDGKGGGKDDDQNAPNPAGT